ncbi:CHAT domain-containing protein [Promicromonospora sp. CA-289599]|uniref:CHAT domain-containing protein n=1 Tax=Promicromonospora sp. CA-289599 TaxID=3240014 RepID=UPI003D8EE0FD
MLSEMPNEALSRTIHAAWCMLPSEDATRLLDDVHAPEALALRQRYFVIKDAVSLPENAGSFRMPFDLWYEQVREYNLADVALRAHQLDDAHQHFERLALLQRPGDFPAAAVEARVGQAGALAAAGKLRPAAEVFAEAIDLARSAGYAHAKVRALIFVGHIQLSDGGLDEAVTTFHEAARTAHERGWQLDEANAAIGLSTALRQRDLHDPEAAASIMGAMALMERINSREGLLNARLEFGELLRMQGRDDEAIDQLTIAADEARNLERPVQLAKILDAVGSAALNAERFDEAERWFRDAAEAAPQDSPLERANPSYNLGKLLRWTGAPEEGLTAFTAARDGYVAAANLWMAATAESGIADCLEQLDDVQAALGHRLDALRMIETGRAGQLGHRSQSDYANRQGQLYGKALQTATNADSAPAFVAAFESLSGRRLAGILEEGTTDDTLLRADVIAARKHTALLAAVAVDLGDPRDEDRFDDIVARIYSPFDPNHGQDLIDSLELADGDTIVTVSLLPRTDHIAWAVFSGSSTITLGDHPISAEAAALIRDLHARGLDPKAELESLAPLGELFAHGLADVLPADGRRISLVPSGETWAVPWSAVPLADGSRFGARWPFTVAPSLTALAYARKTPRPDLPRHGAWWRAPDVASHWADGASFTPLPDAATARVCLLSGTTDLVVTVTHGRIHATDVHYLALDDEVRVTPRDLQDATPARLLAMIACFGAVVPDAGGGDPLTLPVMALVRGSRHVLATTSELLRDQSAEYVNFVLAELRSRPAPEAVHEMVRRWLRRGRFENRPAAAWAPLLVVGA